jgi:hypothetical protein
LRIDGAKLMAGDPEANLFIRPRDTIIVLADAGAPNGAAAAAPKVVQITVEKDGRVRLLGSGSSWDLIASALEKLPDHPSTIVELSADADDVTVGRLFEARAKAQELVRKYGFKQLAVKGIGESPARGGGGGGADAKPQAGPFEVFIAGHVPRPGVYTVRPEQGTTLREVLIGAGATEGDAPEDDNILVTRRKPGGGEEFVRTTRKAVFAPGGGNVPVNANDQVMVGARGKDEKPPGDGK